MKIENPKDKQKTHRCCRALTRRKRRKSDAASLDSKPRRCLFDDDIVFLALVPSATAFACPFLPLSLLSIQYLPLSNCSNDTGGSLSALRKCEPPKGELLIKINGGFSWAACTGTAISSCLRTLPVPGPPIQFDDRHRPAPLLSVKHTSCHTLDNRGFAFTRPIQNGSLNSN